MNPGGARASPTARDVDHQPRAVCDPQLKRAADADALGDLPGAAVDAPPREVARRYLDAQAVPSR